MSPSLGAASTKNIGTKVGKCCGYFPRDERSGPALRKTSPLDAWLARAIDTKCYRTGTPIPGLFG